MLVPGIFLIEKVNDLEEKVWELYQEVSKNNLEVEHLSQDIKRINESLRQSIPHFMLEVDSIMESLKKPPFANKFPEPLITDLEELVSNINNQDIPVNEAWRFIYLFTNTLKKLEELRLSPQKDYEKMLEQFKKHLHTTSVIALKDTEEIQDEIEIILQENRRQNLLINENSIKIEQLDSLKEKISLFSLICILFFCLGLILTFWGFYNWYTKVQIVQDRILKGKEDLEKNKFALSSNSSFNNNKLFCIPNCMAKLKSLNPNSPSIIQCVRI